MYVFSVCHILVEDEFKFGPLNQLKRRQSADNGSRRLGLQRQWTSEALSLQVSICLTTIHVADI